MRIVEAGNWEALDILGTAATGLGAKEEKIEELKIDQNDALERIGRHQALGSEQAADLKRLAQGY